MYIGTIFCQVPEDQACFFSQTVTFKCAINATGYELYFSAMRETGEAQTVVNSVVTTGNVTTSTGTFTLIPAGNGTRVRCIARNKEDGSTQSTSAYAYGQGKDMHSSGNYNVLISKLMID